MLLVVRYDQYECVNLQWVFKWGFFITCKEWQQISATLAPGVHKKKERSTAIYWIPNCTTLTPCDDVYQCTCMMSDVFVDDGVITGPGSWQEVFCKTKYIQLSPRNVRLATSLSNSWTSSSSSHSRSMFSFVSLLLCFWLFQGMSCSATAILVSDFWHCLVDLCSSRARRRWCVAPSTLSVVIAVYVQHQNCCLSIRRFWNAMRWSLVLNTSIAYMGSFSICAPAYT